MGFKQFIQMKKYFLVFGVMILQAVGCNDSDKEIPAGGPCSYSTTTYPARLVKMEKKDSAHFDAIFEVYYSYEWKDSISYYRHFKQFLTQEKIIADQLDTGSVWQYRVDKIISGDCNPKIERLVMEKYITQLEK